MKTSNKDKGEEEVREATKGNFDDNQTTVMPSIRKWQAPTEETVPSQ